MKTIFALLVFFLVVGLSVRVYNGWTRILLITVISVVVLYMSIV